VLDIENFSTIIYIWYEGGELKPPLVRLTFSASPFRTWTIRSGAKGAAAAAGGGFRVSVPGGSHRSDTGSRAPRQTRMKGGIKASWQRKPRAERRRRRRSGNSFSRTKKRGRPSPPFQFSADDSSLQFVDPSQTRTRRITSHCSIRSTTSIPEITRPNTVYRASRCGCGEWVMKN